MLHVMGLLSPLDVMPLAVYCQSFARWRIAEEKLAKMAERDRVTNGLLIKTTTGDVRSNPLARIAAAAASDMLKYASEFGFTPAARARIATGPFGQPPGGGNLTGFWPKKKAPGETARGKLRVANGGSASIALRSRFATRGRPMYPMRLTDDELDTVIAAARPLPVERRDAFLREVASSLKRWGELGPGVVYASARKYRANSLIRLTFLGAGSSKYR
jgi:P27 family predicted phage terminase small subunit